MSNTAYTVFALMILTIVGVVFYVGSIFEGKVERCTEKGGVLIKASQGYVCVSKEAIL